MKAEYIDGGLWRGMVGSMTAQNALAITVSLETGMRIGDVLRLEVSNLLDSSITYTAAKTGKQGTAQCSERLICSLRANAVNGICFPSRKGAKSPYRSRQAVWKDVRKAATYAGIKPHVSPHSARKTFAVDLYHKRGIGAVQQALQHKYQTTTNLYALADVQGAEYNRVAMENRVYEKVLQRLSTMLGVSIEPEEEPEPLCFTGEDDLM